MGKRSKQSKSREVEKTKRDDNNYKSDDASMLEERFAAAETRPQFQISKQNSSKIVLDKRFSSVLTDPRFQLHEKDKYGRKKKKNERDAAKEDLESFYVVEDQNEANNQNVSNEENKKLETDKNKCKSDDSDDVDSDDGEKVEDPISRIAYLTAFSRGELGVSSSSEDDDSSQSSDEDEDEDGEDPVFGTAGVLDPSTNKEEKIEISYDPSPYLVVTNMDWENIRAVDLFAILSSFAIPGVIKKVQVFQSDFGMEKMAKDKLHGPTGIWKTKRIDKLTVSHDVDGGKKIEEHSSDDDDLDHEGSQTDLGSGGVNVRDDSDFDKEELRSYEASKLKYYFAVIEFSHADHADIIYREVDGMEFEHSSTAIDLRTLPKEDLENVTTNRPMRDEATSIPGKYEPPEFIVSALQQTNVQCTWDQGDKERERKLTNYGSRGWQESFETDDLKAYLASDNSSDEDSDSHDDGKADKSSRMRKLLGLDSDDDMDEDNQSSESSSVEGNTQTNYERNYDDEEEDDDDDVEVDAMSKEIKIIPGKKDLENRIRSKLKPKEETVELTPWEKYQEKRKQKRKERRQTARENKKGLSSGDSAKNDRSRDIEKDRDDFFASNDENSIDEKIQLEHQNKESQKKDASKERKAKDELELLLAGEYDEEKARDYDIRGIQRLEKNKGKKLRGSRKRKETKIAADVSGTSFKIDVKDNRFKAVLDGSDSRFGIDKTDPTFKDTSAMREILSEQNKRRKDNRQKKSHVMKNTVPDVDANNSKGVKTSGASALSFLVQKLKSRVDQNKL